MTRRNPPPEAFTRPDPNDALSALLLHVESVKTQEVPWDEAAGRVLAEPITLDRPSPAADVSAMDGYAIVLTNAEPAGDTVWDVAGEVQAGQKPGGMKSGTAMRIFTGALLPAGAQAVIPREQVHENADSIRLREGVAVKFGQHIRRRGENGQPGDVVYPAGRLITAPALAAIAGCGKTSVSVHRPIRVGVIVTGGEVLRTQDTPQPWQLRDSNGPALCGLLRHRPWAFVSSPLFAADEPAVLREMIEHQLADHDALLLTGGVSAGDYDFVPQALVEADCKIIFHKLKIRPGKPLLGAVSPIGQPIFGLPGNPVSVMVTARRFALPALRYRAGMTQFKGEYTLIDVVDEATAPAALTWFPLVQANEVGGVTLIRGKGSGDWVAAAASNGFLEVPPGQAVTGRRRFYRWED